MDDNKISTTIVWQHKKYVQIFYESGKNAPHKYKEPAVCVREYECVLSVGERKDIVSDRKQIVNV